MSIKIWSLIIVSVKAPPTSIYCAKQSSVFKCMVFKCMSCLPGSWHMIECAIFVTTGQFCAGWCYYYFTSSRSQNRIMTCYEWPRNHCAAPGRIVTSRVTRSKVTMAYGQTGRLNTDLHRPEPGVYGRSRTTEENRVVLFTRRPPSVS